MSYVTQTAFSGTVSSLLKIMQDMENDLIAEISALKAKQSQIFTRVSRIDETLKPGLVTQPQIQDVWKKLKEIDNGQVQQWSAITDNRNWISEVNTRLSGTVTQLGQSVGQASTGNILGSLGLGAGIGGLVVLAVLFFVLKGK